MSDYKLIIFDLDDTLLMTSKFILPKAFAELSFFLQDKYDLNYSPEELRTRKRRYEFRGRSIGFFKNLALEIFDLNSDAKIDPTFLEKEIQKIFYERQVSPKEIQLFPGVVAFLESLQGKTVLVTAGSVPTQRQKIVFSGLDQIFNEVHIIDYLSDKNKSSAFRQIQESAKLNSNDILVIGDRYMSEIKAANDLGMRTAWIRGGEHSDEVLADDIQCDFTFATITDLIKAWPLPNRAS